MLLASFLPIFSLLCPSVLDLDSGTGQTDVRQSDDGHQCIIPHPMGARHNKARISEIIQRFYVTLEFWKCQWLVVALYVVFNCVAASLHSDAAGDVQLRRCQSNCSAINHVSRRPASCRSSHSRRLGTAVPVRARSGRVRPVRR